MHKEGHNVFKLLSGNRSLIVREPKNKKEMETSLLGSSRNTALPSEVTNKFDRGGTKMDENRKMF